MTQIRKPSASLTTVLVAFAACVQAQPSQTAIDAIRPGELPLAWETGGPKCMELPEWQIHEYNSDLYILRQSGCTDFEKPFVFLLFGKDRALLLDTGSRRGNLAASLQSVVHRWLERAHRDRIPLIVAHTHSHSDHVAGDAQLQSLADPDIPITYIAPTVEATKKFYGIANWPEDAGSIDLGDRVLDVLAIPGHDIVSIAVYDRQTAILFTGDSVYPGRLYIRDLTAFERSNQRMLKFTEGRPVAHLIGNHIEQKRTPYADYLEGTLWQPQEHALALSRGVLLEIEAGLTAMHGKPRRLAFRDFTLWPVGVGTPESEQERKAVEENEKRQAEHKWDQRP